MKRSEFDKIVRRISYEETKELSQAIAQIRQNETDPIKQVVETITEISAGSAERSARCAAKIIEALGLVSLTDD